MSALDLDGKAALVTGAARGIGQAIAIELAAKGAKLVLVDLLSRSEASETIDAIAKLGCAPRYCCADVGNRTEMERVFAECVNAFGRLDILVNNAAINIRKPLVDLEVDDVAKIWSAGLWGVFHCSQMAARLMVSQGEGGNIVVISSVHSQSAFPNYTAYNAAKAAVNQMARTWAIELAPNRIRVNIIEPGPIDTPGERKVFTEKQLAGMRKKVPLGRMGQPADIAHAVSFLVSPQADFITGSCLRVDGGSLLVGHSSFSNPTLIGNA
jgi:glucose 1-dehydrogenase